MRDFETGATRNDGDHKFDYEGFICPQSDHEFAKYMHSHRKQADGQMRDADNWQKGIPKEVYIKSLTRHMKDLNRLWDGWTVFDPDDNHEVDMLELLQAIRFNQQGLTHEILKDTKI